MTSDFTLFDLLLPYQRKFVLNEKRKKFFIASRQIGKSFCSSFLAVYEAIKKPNQLVLVISTGSRASQEFLMKCDKFAESVKMMSANQISFTKTADKIEFNTGSKILSLPSGNPNALRGNSSNCVIIDECFFIDNPKDVLQAISPTLTRDKDSKLILCSTVGSKSNIFYDIYNSALQDDEWYVQTTNIYDAVKDGLDVNIEDLRKLCPDDNIFRQEFLCDYPDGNNDFIDTSLIQFYIADDDIKLRDYYIGIDFGRTCDGTSISIVGKRDNDECIYLCDLINLHNCEYDRQLEIIKEVYEKYHPISVYGDNGGLGSPLCEKLSKEVSSRIKGYNFTASNKTPAYEYLRNMIFDKKLKINEDFKKLIIQDCGLISQVINENGKVQYISKRSNGSHSDNISSLVLALQALKNSGYNHSLPISHQFSSRFGYGNSRMNYVRRY